MEDEQREAMAAIHPDMAPGVGYCGISTLWALSPEHPFNEACQWHDQQYDLARKGLIKGPNSEDIDAEFYERCLRIAGDDRTLRREAQFFHALCDVWGRYRWPAAAKE